MLLIYSDCVEFVLKSTNVKELTEVFPVDNVIALKLNLTPVTVDVSCELEIYPSVAKPTILEVIVDWTVDIVDK